eukprot:1161048-Pelagomonas_calceolata.AAC.7
MCVHTHTHTRHTHTHPLCVLTGLWLPSIAAAAVLRGKEAARCVIQLAASRRTSGLWSRSRPSSASSAGQLSLGELSALITSAAAAADFVLFWAAAAEEGAVVWVSGPSVEVEQEGALWGCSGGTVVELVGWEGGIPGVEAASLVTLLWALLRWPGLTSSRHASGLPHSSGDSAARAATCADL